MITLQFTRLSLAPTAKSVAFIQCRINYTFLVHLKSHALISSSKSGDELLGTPGFVTYSNISINALQCAAQLARSLTRQDRRTRRRTNVMKHPAPTNLLSHTDGSINFLASFFLPPWLAALSNSSTHVRHENERDTCSTRNSALSFSLTVVVPKGMKFSCRIRQASRERKIRAKNSPLTEGLRDEP